MVRLTHSASSPDHELSSLLQYMQQAFEIGDSDTLARKLQTMRAALHGPRNQNTEPGTLELWTDFDKTVSRAIDGDGGSTKSTWEVLHPTLPEELQEESRADRAACLALQKSDQLTVHDMNAWTLRELARLKQALAKDIKKQAGNIILRSGATELFAFCERQDIQAIIISAGVAEVIEHVTSQHGITISGIVANNLRDEFWDGSAHIGQLVNTRNKRELAELKFPVRPGCHRCIIVLGDNLHDAFMAQDQPNTTVIRIRTAGKRGNTQDYLRESHSTIRLKNDDGADEISPGFDLVLKEQGLEPVTALLKYLAA